MRGRALALWCAVVATTVVSPAVCFTFDCDRDYTDCDTELSKLISDSNDEGAEESVSTSTSIPLMDDSTTQAIDTNTPFLPTIPTPKINEHNYNITEQETIKPRARLLNINMDEFNPLEHNETEYLPKNRKVVPDLSDVTIDEDDDDEMKFIEKVDFKLPKLSDEVSRVNHDINDNFFTQFKLPFHPSNVGEKASTELEMCKENGMPYKIGEKIERGCEEICECGPSGIFECFPRCKHPYIRRGRTLNDPLCFESPVDECCSIIACATGNHGDLKPGASIIGAANSGLLNICRYGNNTYRVGTKWEIGCEQVCTCENNAIVMCKPRCPVLPPSEKCINVQNPNDECCEIQVCDVSQDVHEEALENITLSSTTEKIMITEDLPKNKTVIKTTMRPLVLVEPIGSIKVLQNNSVQINLIHMNTSIDPIHLLLSSDGGRTFNQVDLKYDNLLLNLEGGKDYVIKTKETGTNFNFTITATDNGDNDNEVKIDDLKNVTSKIGCEHDGQFYQVGEEFHIGCSKLCECTGPDTKECAVLDCPAHVGIEILSRGCVRWAPPPPLQPPNCCPRAARCLSDGTCKYKEHSIPNWSEVPIELTGCDQRCYCENGELECQDICIALPALPPPNLRCPPGHRPGPVNMSEDDCCKEWGCISNGVTPDKILPPSYKTTQPPFLPTIPGMYNPYEDYDQNNVRPPNTREPQLPQLPHNRPSPPNYGKLDVLSFQADSPTSVKIIFGLPEILVGLKGSVDLSYTDTPGDDVTKWPSHIFAPENELLATSRLEFRLGGLKPSTTYRIMGKLHVYNLPGETKSEVFVVKTMDLPSMEEKTREIDSQLSLVDVNDTTADIVWRHFTEEELLLIDGIQVRYRSVGTPIYSMTDILHHSKTTAKLHDLRPGSVYEASLVLIPPPRSITELQDPKRLKFETAPYIDPYNWTISVELRAVGSEAAELSWRGVPSPAERWVRVYRAAHACGAGRTKEHDEFRLASRDQPSTITLTGLEPNSRCRVWLELFLSNGKVKTSNVLEVNTKSLDSAETVDNIIEASSISGGRENGPKGNYYGALVAVGVVAALGAVTSLLLLLVVIRRHRPHSVPITSVPSAPRDSSLPPYDNPAYKLELQQETMDL